MSTICYQVIWVNFRQLFYLVPIRVRTWLESRHVGCSYDNSEAHGARILFYYRFPAHGPTISTYRTIKNVIIYKTTRVSKAILLIKYFVFEMKHVMNMHFVP